MKTLDWRAQINRLLEQPLTDDEWELVLRRGTIRPGPPEDGDQVVSDLTQLILDVRRLVSGRALAEPRKRSVKKPDPVGVDGQALLPTVEALRAQIFSEQVAQLAQSDKRLVKFREKSLSNQFLTDDEAWSLLRSPAAAILSPDEFASFAGVTVPIVGHKSTFAVLTPFVRSPGGLDHYYSGTLRIRVGTLDVSDTVEKHFVGRSNRLPLKTLDIELPDERSSQIMVWPDSVLDELWEASLQFSKEYPWSQGQSAWWILTNQAPLIWPIRLVSREHKLDDSLPFERITITIDPWLSARSVAKIYRDLQGAARITPAPRISDRNLRVYQFVSRERSLATDSPAWSELMHRWNKAAADKADRYRDWRPMCRDYRRAEIALTGEVPIKKLRAKRKAVKRSARSGISG